MVVSKSLVPHSKSPRSNPHRIRSPFLPALCTIGLIAILGFAYTTVKQHDTTDSHASQLHRRSLRTQGTAGVVPLDSHQPCSALRAPLPGYSHHLLVLAGGGEGGAPTWDADALQQAAGKVVWPLRVTWFKGAEAGTLGNWLGVERLPAVAYVHPHCMPATCGAPAVLEIATGQDPAGGGISRPATSAEDVAAWMKLTGRHPILMANDHDTVAYNFRHVRDPSSPEVGKPLGEFVLQPRRHDWIETPLGADWVVTPVDNMTTGPPPKPVVTLKVKGDTHLVVHRPGDCNLFADPGCRLPLPHLTFSADTLKKRQHNLAKMNNDIRDQEKTQRRFTAHGFKKTRAPPLLYAILKEFFDAHKNNSVVEHWDADNIYVNHHASRFMLVDLPGAGSMTPTLFELLRPILEDWIGGQIPLVPSSIYGVRVYTKGSALQNHVDRAGTHQVSAVINVDQDVDAPWPLEVLDHADQLHKILMKPGDMVLYEGASRTHGRPTPLKGRWLANTFLQYALPPAR